MASNFVHVIALLSNYSQLPSLFTRYSHFSLHNPSTVMMTVGLCYDVIVNNCTYEISGSHGGKYKDDCLLGCYAM
jgi:hypothetical protein